MPSEATYPITDKDGTFKRKDSAFRNFISSDPNSRFPAEKDRYVLYANLGCPWAHRAIITRELKGLDSVVQMVLTGHELSSRGWLFDGTAGSEKRDPVYGAEALSEIYYKADPEYTGRFTVPCLFDKETETIVNNESSEIIRMFYSEFDDLLPAEMREVNKPGGGFYPPQLRKEIDEMNDWVYHTVNNGVYKCGFAGTQEAYEDNLLPLFDSLDRLEEHLGLPGHSPYLFGSNITEADIRLYTTMARFDVAYVNIFLCNLKMIRHDYPRLSRWLRNLYWDESPRTNGGAFYKTTYFHYYKVGYTKARSRRFQDPDSMAGKEVVIPRGPEPNMLPLTDREKQQIEAEIAYANGNSVNGHTTDMQGSGLTAQQEFAASSGLHENGQDDLPADAGLDGLSEKEKLERRTAYEEENKKWRKQIKKATKDEPPAVHLASS